MTTKAAQQTCHCYNKKMYFLVQLPGAANLCNGITGSCNTPNLFDVPPGLNALNGEDCGGLTLAQFVEGYVEMDFIVLPAYLSCG